MKAKEKENTESKNMSYKNVLLAFMLILAIFPSVVLGESHPDVFEADVVVYGATPGGLPAAAAAAREGKSVLLYISLMSAQSA